MRSCLLLHDNFVKKYCDLVGDHVVYPELGVPVREAGGAGGHEGGGGGAAGVGVVHDEPVVVGVAVELRRHRGLEPDQHRL